MSELQNESDGDFINRIQCDAMKWAEEYMLRFGEELPDKMNLFGWFANAIQFSADNHPRATALRTDRNTVLEEAAKVADDIAEKWGKRWQYTSDKHETYDNGRIAGWSDGAADVAKSIRALAKDDDT